MKSSPHSHINVHKLSRDDLTRKKDKQTTGKHVFLAYGDWIEEQADYVASHKCLWWLKFVANDIANELLPEAVRYDPDEASYLGARLSAIKNDVALLEQRMRDVPKRLIEAYRLHGGWTYAEQVDAYVVHNLIGRLRDYGVIPYDEDDKAFDDAIYEDLTRRERQKTDWEATAL